LGEHLERLAYRPYDELCRYKVLDEVLDACAASVGGLGKLLMLDCELLILVGKFLDFSGIRICGSHIQHLLLDGCHLVLHGTEVVAHIPVGLGGTLDAFGVVVESLELAHSSGNGLLKILCVSYDIAKETSNLLLNQGHVARLLLHALLINEGEHVVLVLAKIGLCGLDCLVGV
jgi:hypothetical protein